MNRSAKSVFSDGLSWPLWKSWLTSKGIVTHRLRMSALELAYCLVSQPLRIRISCDSAWVLCKLCFCYLIYLDFDTSPSFLWVSWSSALQNCPQGFPFLTAPGLWCLGRALETWAWQVACSKCKSWGMMGSATGSRAVVPMGSMTLDVFIMTKAMSRVWLSIDLALLCMCLNLLPTLIEDQSVSWAFLMCCTYPFP